MKYLLIILLFISVTLSAQKDIENMYRNMKFEKTIPVATLSATFLILEVKGDKMTYLNRSIVAITGMIITVGYVMIREKHKFRMNLNK